MDDAKIENKRILRAIADAFEVVDHNEFKPRFSPSVLPVCPREHVIYLTAPDDLAAVQSFDFNGEFFTTMGTVIHTVIQRQLGKAQLLFGNWSCCGISYSDCFASRCIVCGRWPTYDEYKVDKSLFGIGGFVDGYIPSLEAILEVKSKSTAAIQKMTEPIWYEWAYQASIYSVALERQYGFKTNRIIMCYISRENPRVRKVFITPVKRRVLDSQVSTYRKVNDYVKLNVLPTGICTTQSEGEANYCMYAGICFRPDLARKLGLTEEKEIKNV